MNSKWGMFLLAASLPWMTHADDGQAVYDKHCKVCHVAGVGGAPKPGDTAAWESRKAEGMDVMLQTVISGKGAMPAKGTCMSCDDATLQAAIDILIAE